MKKNRSGFTLIEIMIVVGIIGLLAAIAIPSFIRSRERSHATVCANNLRQFQSAKEQYAMETGLANGQMIQPSTALNGYLVNLTVNDRCPAGGHYIHLDDIGTPVECDFHGTLPF